MSRLFPKLLVSFLVGIIMVMSLAPVVLAQTTPLTGASSGPWYSQSFTQWYSKVYDTSNTNEIFGERYTAAQVQWVFFGVVSFLVNLASGNNPAVTQCLTSGDAKVCQDKINAAIKNIDSLFTKKTSDSGQQKTLLGEVFADRTLSGVTYVKDIFRKFHVIPEAHAQTPGFGYTGALGIVPDIQEAWRAVRDIAYAIFVVVIIAFAFMIMFRMKISPQAVVTVQSALPKIAIALILVTFSYAIAGFLIDAMYVVIGIISIIFSQFNVAGISFGGIFGVAAGTSAVVGYFDLLTKGPTLTLLPLLLGPAGAGAAALGVGVAAAAGAGGGASTGVLGLLIVYWINYVMAYVLIALSGIAVGVLGALGGGGAGALGGGAVGVIALVVGLIGLVIVFIMMIINFFRIILLLGRAFLTILLLTIFAPLQLTLGIVMPGIGFGAWVKSFIAKLAVFPAVGVLFLIALWLLNLAYNVMNTAAGGGGVFAAGWPPLLGGSPQLVALGFLVASIAVFLMIPSAGKMVESIMAGKGFGQFGAREAFGPAAGLVNVGVGAVTGGVTGELGYRAGAFAYRRAAVTPGLMGTVYKGVADFSARNKYMVPTSTGPKRPGEP